jgi:hypothetical protein
MIARLRQETVTRLAGLPGIRRVLDSRQVQVRRAMLPAIRVYTSASAENLSPNVQQYRTTISLVVQVIADDSTDADNAELVDDLCFAVKDRLLRDVKWLMLFERVLSFDTAIELNNEGDSRTVIGTLTFEIQESEVYEPIIEDDFERGEIQVDVIRPAADPNVKYPGPDGRIEAGSRFEFEYPEE